MTTRDLARIVDASSGRGNGDAMTRNSATTSAAVTGELKLLSDVGLDGLPYTERLLLALEAVTLAALPQARDAERFAARIRFATARVDELQGAADNLGGVFEPSRLEVAISILDAHTSRAASFVEAIVAKARKAPQRAAASSAARVAATAAEPAAVGERRAA